MHQLSIRFMETKPLYPWLAERFNWAQRLGPALEPELCRLLVQLTPADQIDLLPLPMGQSGAAVLLVYPYQHRCEGIPFVVKIGKTEKVRQEYENYNHFVEFFISAFSLSLGYAPGEQISALAYRLIGPRLREAANFADFYEAHEVGPVCNLLDKLFRETCGLWYHNRQPPRHRHNLVTLYEASLHLDWTEVWAGAATTGVDLTADKLAWPNLPGRFLNPKRWLEQRHYSLTLPVWQTMTHGDLNESNILILEDQPWLIDFYRTGLGHNLRDFVELETALKFKLTPIPNLANYQRFEEILLGQSRLDQPYLPRPNHPYHKPLAVIGYLRRLADTLSGSGPAMTEYLTALLLSTLNLLRLASFRMHYAKILLSAALLCERLSEKVNSFGAGAVQAVAM